jgi:hypothetical protein
MRRSGDSFFLFAQFIFACSRYKRPHAKDFRMRLRRPHAKRVIFTDDFVHAVGTTAWKDDSQPHGKTLSVVVKINLTKFWQHQNFSKIIILSKFQ